MDYNSTEAKSMRLLALYSRLLNGETIKKQELVDEFGVTQRSIQRDIEDLRVFFSEERQGRDVSYDPKTKGYRLDRHQAMGLSDGELLTVCKILLESRSLRQDEMLPILTKISDACAAPVSRKTVKDLIANESHHYIPPKHDTKLVDRLWVLGEAIRNQVVVEITYQKLKGPELVSRRLQPVGLMFSEYYFYLIGFVEELAAAHSSAEDWFPIVYRVDRISSLSITKERFQVPYRTRFEEGEFRKRIQFMYSGKLQTVKFKYVGPSVEAVLDRLPTAKIISQDDKGYWMEAGAFGDGIYMWLRSQGDWVEEVK